MDVPTGLLHWYWLSLLVEFSGGSELWGLIALSPQGKNREEVFLINGDWQSLGGNCVMWVTGSRKLGVGWQKLRGTLHLNSLAFSVSALFGEEVCFLASWRSSFPQILFKLPGALYLNSVVFCLVQRRVFSGKLAFEVSVDSF